MATGRPDRDPDVTMPFGHDAGAARRARAAIRELVSDPNDPIVDALTLSASELVTNAVRHTDDGGTMRGWDPSPENPVRLEVEDHDATMPTMGDVPEPGHRGGRGLRIVDDVSDEWGVERTAHGKIMWAEFDRSDKTTPD